MSSAPEIQAPVPGSDAARRRRKRGIRLALVVLGMVGFAFINIPLFRAFCSHYGIFTGENEQLAPTSAKVDPNRKVNVLFDAEVPPQLPVSLVPSDSLQTVHLQQRSVDRFTFTNNSDHVVRFRAIHSVYPYQAATHLAIIQCFCFSDQTMQPHETKTLPVIYQMNAGLDPLVERISVMYTLEPLAPAAPAAAGGQ